MHVSLLLFALGQVGDPPPVVDEAPAAEVDEAGSTRLDDAELGAEMTLVDRLDDDAT